MKLAAFISLLFISWGVMVKFFTYKAASYTLYTLAFLIFMAGSLLIIFNAGKLKRINVCHNLSQKVVMTASLGFFYTAVFLIINYFLKEQTHRETFFAYFRYGLEKPWVYLYIACTLFVFNSITIIAIRKIVASLYLLRKLRK